MYRNSTKFDINLANLFSALENKERLEEMKRILHDELPDDNYFILKYVINFLQEVRNILFNHFKVPENFVLTM